MAANPWNVVNLVLTDATGILQIPPGHVLLQHIGPLVTLPGPGGGLATVHSHYLALMALYLSQIIISLDLV